MGYYGDADEMVSVLLDRPMSKEEKDVLAVVSGVNALIAGDRYSMLSFIMASTDPSKISTEFMLSLLRVSFPVRARINSWDLFLKRSADAITASGRDYVRLLVGLFDDASDEPQPLCPTLLGAVLCPHYGAVALWVGMSGRRLMGFSVEHVDRVEAALDGMARAEEERG